jgi:acylpyruvate hydrolase
MKIICIGHNYANHNIEMKTAATAEPVFFMKPDTALLADNKPFYYPGFSKDIQYEVELVLKISKNGKNIEPGFAGNYYQEIGIGIDFTARDLQAQCKANRKPWEKAKSFDHSAPVGKFIPKNEFPDLNNISFQLNLNGKTVQKGNTKNMLFSFDNIISYISTFITLRKGDLIFTGTPEGVGPVKIGDRLEAFTEGRSLMHLEIK